MCNDDLSQDTGGTYPAGVFIYISSADKMSALLCKLLFTIFGLNKGRLWPQFPRRMGLLTPLSWYCKQSTSSYLSLILFVMTSSLISKVLCEINKNESKTLLMANLN